MGFFETKRTDSHWDQITQTPEKLDWTHFLSPDATGILRSVLEAAYKHRKAYFKSEDIRNAQLWSAIIEMKREINDLNQKIERLTAKPTPTFRLGIAQDSEVLNKIKQKLQPTIEDSQEASDALINSLMKF